MPRLADRPGRAGVRGMLRHPVVDRGWGVLSGAGWAVVGAWLPAIAAALAAAAGGFG